MVNKKRKEEIRARRERNKKITQIVSITLIVLALAAILWAVIAGQKPATTTEATAQPAAGASAQPAAPAANAKQYASAPPMTLDKTKQYFATVKMAKGGEFVIQLYADKAPITVNSFVFLAREGFFNGTTFHRVIDGFMAQGGDPAGTGSGGPGYSFVDETNNGLTFDSPGLLAMANSGPNTNGSQFFITYGTPDWLNGKHTIFGKVTSGMDVVNGITRRDPSQNPTFSGDVMESITITEK